MPRKVYAVAGSNSIFMGPGRKEFNPKKKMPDFLHYLREATAGCLQQIPHPTFDEGIIGNFMAARFIRQGNLAAFLPELVPDLLHKPCYRAEGACCSGGLAITMGIKSILSQMSDSVFVCGFEIQNSVKALYGADILAGAAFHQQERQVGHAYFFPNLFSLRAGAYMKKYGENSARLGMANWYKNAIKNARQYPQAQEYHNKNDSLLKSGMTSPNKDNFVEYLNLYDCSKVSDGASALVLCSEEGLKKIGLAKSQAVEILAFNNSTANICKSPKDLCELPNTKYSIQQSLKMCGAKISDIGLLELHDCFSISALLALEAGEFCQRGEAAQFIANEETTKNGQLPVNLSGGLCGFGHPTGATGVRQLVDLIEQFRGKANNQADLKKDLGMMINMGGNDKTLTTVVIQKSP
ncbi:MAG: 3-ketoacyl-CoA thiolase [Lentisphaeraceae bacterium]|nr:3-ketoacyl-CoA thiolase [Lentisphaeraceae bacterium]